MSLPFDATLKDLLEISPVDWLTFLGLPITGPVKLIDADLSTVTAQADRVILVGGPTPWILHLEFQTGPDPAFPRRAYKYNGLLVDGFGFPVHTVVILLRPKADRIEINGDLRLQPPGGPETVFRYTVIRVWEKQVEPFLAGSLSLLPLAPLAENAAEALPAIIQRMNERLEQETTRQEAAKLWTATYILMGLRYERDLINHLLQGVRAMKDSVTHQAILEEGEEKGKRKGREEGREKGREEGRKEGRKEGREEGIEKGFVDGELAVLLHQGQKRFGDPSSEILAKLQAVTDADRIIALIDGIPTVKDWEDLLKAL